MVALGALATAGCVGGETFEADFVLNPTSGPSGTIATVSVEANDVDLPIELSDGRTTQEATLDDTGYYATPWEFVGEPGDAIVLELIVFGDDEIVFESSATFTITDSPEEGTAEETDEETAEATEEQTSEDTAEETEATEEATEEEDEATEEATAGATGEEQPAAAVDVEVSVDPASGPAGETATITVTGEPNAPVTLTINGVGSTGGTTDADGNYTFETTFSGNDGDEIPVEAEVGVGADTRSGSATYTIDNPESACSVTADDLVVEQFHDTGALSPELVEANALSSIRVQSNACEFEPGTFFVSISDANASGTVDDGDAFFITPQPAVGGNAEMGIDRGGNYFIGIIAPDDVVTVTELTGMPFDGPTRSDDGGWQVSESFDVTVQIVERGPDDQTPAFYNVDFGDPVMVPLP